MSKPFYRSKEVWASALALLILLGQFFGVEPNQEVLATGSKAYVAIYPLIILVLRLFLTKGKLSFK